MNKYALLFALLCTGCKALDYPKIPVVEISIDEEKCFDRDLIDQKTVTFSSAVNSYDLYVRDSAGTILSLNPDCEIIGHRPADFKKAQNFARDAQD